MNRIALNKWLLPSSVGVVCFTSGFGFGYIFAKKKIKSNEVYIFSEQLTLPIEKKIEDESKSESSFLDVVGAKSNFSKYQELVREYVVGEEGIMDPDTDSDSLDLADINESVELSPSDSEEVFRLFSNSRNPWNFEKEVGSRTASKPYVIHVEEWVNNEKDYRQTTLTYYAGDDILTDENDIPLTNYQDIVGSLRFGHGSNDPNVVYIRNEILEAEYEILNNPESYEVSVLGHDVEQEFNRKDLRNDNLAKQRFRKEE